MKNHDGKTPAMSLQVSEAEACSIARAFWEEFSPHLCHQPASAHLLAKAAALSKTGHGNRFTKCLPEYGLAADIPLTYVNVGLTGTHPILSVFDTVRCLDECGKLDVLLQGNSSRQFQTFWRRWRLLQPHHPVFLRHAGREGCCVPIAVHADEGNTLKKKSIMILQLQGCLGFGTRKRKSTEEEPGVNMLGSSYTTRILFSVMLGRAYGGKRKNAPLLKLVSHLAGDLQKAFNEGITLQNHALGKIFLVPICLKGDWPALAKIGSLTRHFGRLVTSDSAVGKGICHLCKADQPGFENWHNLSYENMEKMRKDAPLPWTVEPSLVAAFPFRDADKPDFFRFDMFHCLHKGFMGDMAANAIVSCLCLLKFTKGLQKGWPKLQDISLESTATQGMLLWPWTFRGRSFRHILWQLLRWAEGVLSQEWKNASHDAADAHLAGIWQIQRLPYSEALLCLSILFVDHRMFW